MMGEVYSEKDILVMISRWLVICLIVKGIKTQTGLGRGGVECEWWLRHLEEEEG